MYREQVLNVIKKMPMEEKAKIYERIAEKYLEMMEVAKDDNELVLPYFTEECELDFKYRTYTGVFCERIDNNPLNLETKRGDLSLNLARYNSLVEKKKKELAELEERHKQVSLSLLVENNKLNSTKNKLVLYKNKLKTAKAR